MNFSAQKGVRLAFLTAIISGIAIFINKFAVGAITPPLVFTATKNAGVGLLLLAWLGMSGQLTKIKHLTRDQLVKLGLIGVIGGAIPFYLFFTGLSQISAASAGLIHKTLVLWVALLAGSWLKERLSFLQGIAIGLLFVSNLFIGGFTGFLGSTGELMVLAATILWAIETVIAKRILKTVDPDLVVAARMGFGALLLVAAAAIKHPQNLLAITALTGIQWFWLAATAATLLGYTMSWYRALRAAPAVTVTSILVASTVVTNALSAIFITHTWTPAMGWQALTIIIGLGLFISQGKSVSRQSKLALR